MYKFLFLMMLLISITLVMSSSNLFFTWMMMEFNMISFIPMIYNKSKYNKFNIIAMMNYFLIQSFSSMIFLFSILTNLIYMNMELLLIFKSLMILSLMIKLSFYPFHFWFLKMMIMMNWLKCFMLSFIQKIIPMIILMNLNFMSKLILLFNLMNSFFSTFMGLNQSSLKLIMSFSSMSNLSWFVLILMSTNFKLFLKFYLIYIIINLGLMYTFFKFNTNFINKIFKLKLKYKIFIPLLILSLSGLPPFSGFLLKWMFASLLNNNYFNLSMFFLFYINSSITMLYYFKVFMPLMLSNEVLNHSPQPPMFLPHINLKLIMFYSLNMLIFNNLIF
uniref:NADH-ubiquinone oxidoreductase chain 2 n=1 Tax=Scelio sp. ZJUH_2016028 TaxID=2496283 RepID=A0A3Q8UAA0_9HYME|nr:NADH dehydrogenase subunit 2 [Scelio sp. ZJUH_2016028]